MKNLFRKASIERLSSPEQIDKLLVIIRSPGWIALLAAVVLIFLILVWSFVGQIPVTADGRGILFNPDSIVVVQSKVGGFVSEIKTREGDAVQRGDELAHLSDATQSLEYKALQNTLDKVSKRDLTEEQKWEVVKLEQEGYILEQNLKNLTIRSPVEGIVLTVEALLGEKVESGSTLFWIEGKEKKSSSVYAFFSLGQGDLIQEGMLAHIELETVNAQIYGKIEGRVKRIFPFSAESQGDVLQNIPSERLREYLTQNRASITVEVEPVLDASTKSGYKWTTEEGPPFALRIGTVGEVSVFLDEKKPISYLFPIGDK
ncbi:MAG: hypothetical protein S4CHLAM123_02260 [Chlamydiales bacterium]|nr:hypothetical protein [Chlamydiales bacterium]